MINLQIWIDALTKSNSIEIESSGQLAQEINALPSSKSIFSNSKIAKEIPNIDKQIICFTIADLLLTTGRITTPQIPNLVDISSTWALLRYIWAFDSSISPQIYFPLLQREKLILSDDAWNIDFHQKALMSDELGVGMAALVIREMFGGINPVDVSLALKGINFPVNIRRGQKTTPDYIFTNNNGQYIVTECKGTTSGHLYSKKQLKRGLEQVSSLVFSANQTPLTIISGTSFTKSDTKVFIIDPPPDEKPNSSSSRTFHIVDKDQFDRDIRICQKATMYTFAGSPGKALALLNRSGIFFRDTFLNELLTFDEPPVRLSIEKLGHNYVGTQHVINIFGNKNKIRVFQGINEDIYNMIDNHEDDNKIQKFAEIIYQSAKTISYDQQYNGNHDNYTKTDGEINYCSSTMWEYQEGNLIVDTVGPDGSFLRIEVSDYHNFK